jgi:hypothetical protein
VKNNVSKKRNSSKKKKNKVTFKEYLRRKGRDIWYDREAIIFCVGIIAVFGFLYFMTHYNPNNDSEICTIESVEIIEHEDPYAISGVFETEECGIITSSKSPDGIPIRKYLQNFETGKKYRAYKSFSTRNDEFDFSVLRFEEIKE